MILAEFLYGFVETGKPKIRFPFRAIEPVKKPLEASRLMLQW